MRRAVSRVLGEVWGGSGIYALLFFIYLTGIFAGRAAFAKTGADLMYGSPAGALDALFVAFAPFCIYILSALSPLGLPVNIAMTIFCGVSLGCGAARPSSIAFAAVQIPCLLYFSKSCLVFSVLMCKNKGKGLNARLMLSRALFRPFLICAFVCAAASVLLAFLV